MLEIRTVAGPSSVVQCVLSGLRPTRTRHHDRADRRPAGRCRSKRAKGARPRKVDDAAAAKAPKLREKGVAATDIAKMLRVSRATVYRNLADGASLVP